MEMKRKYLSLLKDIESFSYILDLRFRIMTVVSITYHRLLAFLLSRSGKQRQRSSVSGSVVFNENLKIIDMNIIAKLDQWYKEWHGESHLHTSGIPTHDSAEAQDFAEYCIKEFLNEVEKSRSEAEG
jgi:hypothetical protein